MVSLSSSPHCILLCSALTVLASSSGVTSERQAFMGLVKTEIDRLNASNPNQSLSMVFRQGGVTVSTYTCVLSPFLSFFLFFPTPLSIRKALIVIWKSGLGDATMTMATVAEQAASKCQHSDLSPCNLCISAE